VSEVDLMSSPPSIAAPRRSRTSLRLVVASAAAVALLVAMALDTKVVRIGGGADVQLGGFSPAAYGPSEFPKVQNAIAGHAVAAPVLAAAIAKDPAAAAKAYGVDSGVGPEMPVSFTGVAGKEDSGVYDVKVDGVPDTVTIRVQTGPAIMGTDLRDGTGTISFGQFTNQIEYQNAGSALNKEMKKEVLSKLDLANLAGKTLSVVGIFQLTDPTNWLVTPVKVDVR